MMELMRSYAKAEARRQGYTKVNRIMSSGRWCRFLGTFAPPAPPRPKRAK